MKTLKLTKGYGNQPKLAGKQFRTGPLGTAVGAFVGSNVDTLAVEITSDDLTTDGAAQTLQLPDLPHQAEVLKVLVDAKTSFASSTDTSMNSLLLTVGTASGGAQYENGLQLLTAAAGAAEGRTTLTPASGSAFDVTSTGELHLSLTCAGTGGDEVVKDIDSGKLVIAVLYVVMPT